MDQSASYHRTELCFGSDCKSLVIPYFQTKYKECLSLNGGVDCNQYVDFSFLEALQSACMADGRDISKLKLSKDELFALFDETLLTGTIDFDRGLDELERLNLIETSDEQVNVYPSSQDANGVLSWSTQKPQAALDPNTAIPDQTKNSLGSVLRDLLKIDLTSSFEMGFKLMRELLQQNKEQYKVDHLSRYHIAIDFNLIGSDSFR